MCTPDSMSSIERKRSLNALISDKLLLILFTVSEHAHATWDFLTLVVVPLDHSGRVLFQHFGGLKATA